MAARRPALASAPPCLIAPCARRSQRGGWYHGEDFYESWIHYVVPGSGWTAEVVQEGLATFCRETCGWDVTVADWRAAAAAAGTLWLEGGMTDES